MSEIERKENQQSVRDKGLELIERIWGGDDLEIPTEILEFAKEIGVRESDRGCILMSVSILDDALEKLLKAMFLNCTKGEITEKEMKKLLKDRPLAPLGNFSVRCRVAKALGLIGKEIYDAFDSLRSVRNACAHDNTKMRITEETIQIVLGPLDEHEAKVINVMPDAIRAELLHSTTDTFTSQGITNDPQEVLEKSAETIDLDGKLRRNRFLMGVMFLKERLDTKAAWLLNSI